MKILLGNEITEYNAKKCIIKNEINSRLITNASVKNKFRYPNNLKKQLKSFTLYGKNEKLLDKRVIKYRRHLANRLNIIHNKNYNINYWGFLIDTFLVDFIGALISEQDSLNELIKKNKNLSIDYQDESIKSYDSQFFFGNLYNPKFQNFFLYLVAKRLKINSNKKKKSYIYNFNHPKSNSANICRYILNILVKIFKPSLIENDYKKLRYKFFDLKKEKKNYYLFFKSKIFNNHIDYSINSELRLKLKLSGSLDSLDKHFNDLIIYYFPASYLENFEKIRLMHKNFIDKTKLFIGTSMYRYSDFLKILLAEKKYIKKKKIYCCSHSAFENLRKKSRSYNFLRKYSNKYFPYLSKKNKIFNKCNNFKIKKFKEDESEKKIIIFGSVTRAFHSNNFYICSKENHPYCSSDLKFYKLLDKEIKKKTFIKLFPSTKHSYKITKEMWTLSENKHINFFEKNVRFSDLHKFDLLVLTEFSTAVFESLLSDRPFIIIYENSILNLKNNIKKKVFKIKKI